MAIEDWKKTESRFVFLIIDMARPAESPMKVSDTPLPNQLSASSWVPPRPVLHPKKGNGVTLYGMWEAVPL